MSRISAVTDFTGVMLRVAGAVRGLGADAGFSIGLGALSVRVTLVACDGVEIGKRVLFSEMASGDDDLVWVAISEAVEEMRLIKELRGAGKDLTAKKVGSHE